MKWPLRIIKSAKSVTNDLIEKTTKLKGLVSKYDSSEFLKHIATILIQIGQRESNPMFKDLMSPMRQLFYLASLNLESINVGTAADFSREEWGEMTTLLRDIEAEYFLTIGFGKERAPIADHDKVGAVLSTFMNYYFNGPLGYLEQQIEKIERVFGQFREPIKQNLGLELGDFVSLYDFLTDAINENLTYPPRLLASSEWQKFTSAAVAKGLTDPMDWIDESPIEVHDAMDFMRNPGRMFVIDLTKLNKEEEFVYRLRTYMNLICCERSPKEEITFYTEEVLLLNRPIFKVSNDVYLIFYQKQLLHATYSLLFRFCRRLDETTALKARDCFLEDKVEELFKKSFGGNAFVYRNYSVDGHSEQDLLVLHRGLALIVEIKAGGYRGPMRDPLKAYEKLQSDFKKIIQLAYDQTSRVKTRFMANETFDLLNLNGNKLYEINPRKFHHVFSIVVTWETFGMIQSDLEKMLTLNPDDEFPWAVGVDDLEAFLLMLARGKSLIQRLTTFLEYRELFHGHLICGDELELCGLFLVNQKMFVENSQSEHIICTWPDLTNPFEAAYRSGLGLRNERNYEAKRNGDVRFLFDDPKT